MANMVAMPRKPEWVGDFTDQMLKGAELMAEGNMTQKMIAQEIGVTEQTISRSWKHNQLWLQYVNYLTTLNTLESALKIKGLTARAVEQLGDLLESPAPDIRLRAIKEILDRSGVKDLAFDLLPKEQKSVDVKIVRDRLQALVEADDAEEEIFDVSEYTTFDTKDFQENINKGEDTNG